MAGPMDQIRIGKQASKASHEPDTQGQSLWRGRATSSIGSATANSIQLPASKHAINRPNPRSWLVFRTARMPMPSQASHIADVILRKTGRDELAFSRTFMRAVNSKYVKRKPQPIIAISVEKII